VEEVVKTLTNFVQSLELLRYLNLERPGQLDRELGREEPDEVQQGQMQGPASGEEQPHAPVQAWGGPAEVQLCGGGPGCPGG